MHTAAISNRFSTLDLTPSFGFGDRIGLATPGHIESMRRAGTGFAPIFAQQSIREMGRTGRTACDVIGAAVEGMELGDWRDESGADADHLKTSADVDITSAAGFTFYTIDPSDYVDRHADDYDEHTLRAKFTEIQELAPWSASYVNFSVALPAGRTFTIDEQAAQRCAVKYGRALHHAIDLAKYIVAVNESAGRACELELSIDETPQPTSLAEHYIIADQFRQDGLQLISIAPKFIGDFEKGIDYKGDLVALEHSLADHAA